MADKFNTIENNNFNLHHMLRRSFEEPQSWIKLKQDGSWTKPLAVRGFDDKTITVSIVEGHTLRWLTYVIERIECIEWISAHD